MKPVEESFKFLPGFQLNLHNRNENPLFESHDPSMMKDPVSGYYYSYGTDAAITSKRKLDIPVRKSKDLVHFTYEGTVLDQKSIEEAMNYVARYKKHPDLSFKDRALINYPLIKKTYLKLKNGKVFNYLRNGIINKKSNP